MNAGGVPNTCKSDVPARVHGRRVSNAWGTYLFVGNNTAKAVLIPHNIFGLHDLEIKSASCLRRGSRLIS